MVTQSHEICLFELDDELERDRYFELQRSSQTFEIICDAWQLGRILQEMDNGPTQATLFDLETPHDAYYAEVTQYLGNYMWRIGDHFPTSDAGRWEMFERHHGMLPIHKGPGRFCRKGQEPKTNFLTENRERRNYTSLDYTHRPDTIEDPTGDTEGILTEWGEVGIADSCAQTLLKIQTLTNDMQKQLDENRMP